MTLPFEPEIDEMLQNRFEKALERVYDVETMMNGGLNEDRPGVKREHVFDFQDGVRLIISKDRTAKGKTFLHVSGSSYNKKMSPEELIKVMAEKILELHKGNISGVMQAVKTSGGIIHMLLELGPDWHSKVILPPTYNAN